MSHDAAFSPRRHVSADYATPLRAMMRAAAACFRHAGAAAAAASPLPISMPLLRHIHSRFDAHIPIDATPTPDCTPLILMAAAVIFAVPHYFLRHTPLFATPIFAPYAIISPRRFLFSPPCRHLRR